MSKGARKWGGQKKKCHRGREPGALKYSAAALGERANRRKSRKRRHRNQSRAQKWILKRICARRVAAYQHQGRGWRHGRRRREGARRRTQRRKSQRGFLRKERGREGRAVVRQQQGRGWRHGGGRRG
eukprot:scaffold288121_cov15-Tisochrysis_lutea.AAC.1